MSNSPLNARILQKGDNIKFKLKRERQIEMFKIITFLSEENKCGIAPVSRLREKPFSCNPKIEHLVG